MQKTASDFVVPFWDPFCSLVCIALNDVAIHHDVDAISIEHLQDNGRVTFIGEIRLSRAMPKRIMCASDVPYFAVPDQPSFKLVFRAYAGQHAVAEQIAAFDGNQPEEQLVVSCGLLWRHGGEPPQIVMPEQIEGTPAAVRRHVRSYLQCRMTRDGRYAPAFVMEPPAALARDVQVVTTIVEEFDSIENDQVRQREHVEIIIELEHPLEASFDESFKIGVHDWIFSRTRIEELEYRDLTFNVNPFFENDGYRVRIPIGPLVPQTVVFVACLGGDRLRAGGRERRVAAYLVLGRHARLDEKLSLAFDRRLDQDRQNYFRFWRPLLEVDGVRIGPAQLAVEGLLEALAAVGLAAEDDTSEAVAFARLLRASGIEPLSIASIVRHANVIHALQWPKAFMRWQKLLLSGQPMAPLLGPSDLVERVARLESQSQVGGLLDTHALQQHPLAAWQRLRSGLDLTPVAVVS